MHVVSVENAIKDIPGLINRTIKNVEEVVIVSDDGGTALA